MKKDNKGFTLAELLIVVAIIAVLVAISIPIFTTQLENSREATDAANVRSAYAEVVAAALNDGTKDITATVAKTQKVEDWQNTNIADIGGVKVGDGIKSTDPSDIKYEASTGKVTIDGIEVESKITSNN